MEAIRPQQGPFSVISVYAPEGLQLVSLPYADVAGSQLVAAVIDNWARLIPTSFRDDNWPIAEISVWGSVAGYEMCLKRQQVRMDTGPLSYVIPTERKFTDIRVKGRNFSGGRSVKPVAGANPPTEANGYKLEVMLYVQAAQNLGNNLGPKKPGML